MTRTLSQNKWMWDLINKAHYSKDEIETQVLSMTSGRTASTKEMTADECRAYIGWLGVQVHGDYRPGVKFNPIVKQVTPGDKMRKQIFSIMYELHVIHAGMTNLEKVMAINKYLMDGKSTLKKQLKELTETELQNTIKQLNIILKNTLKKQ